MLGPGPYCPEPTEGITRSEDLPKPRVVQQCRNFKRQPCPRCDKSSYRDRVFTHTLHHTRPQGDTDVVRARSVRCPRSSALLAVID